MLGREFLLDALLPAGQPVHGRVNLVRAGRGHPEIHGQGGVLPPPGRGRFRAGSANPGDDQRQHQVPGLRRRPEQRRQPERRRLRPHRGDMPVRQGPHDRGPAVRRDQLLALQSGLDTGDHMVRQRRQVRDRLVADLPVLTPRAPQIRRLVLTRFAVFVHMRLPHSDYVNRATPFTHTTRIERPFEVSVPDTPNILTT